MIAFVLKAQYEFIHYALGELVVCGETEVTASNLKSFTDSLREPVNDSGLTLSQQHMKVTLISYHTPFIPCLKSIFTVRYWRI